MQDTIVFGFVVTVRESGAMFYSQLYLNGHLCKTLLLQYSSVSCFVQDVSSLRIGSALKLVVHVTPTVYKPNTSLRWTVKVGFEGVRL